MTKVIVKEYGGGPVHNGQIRADTKGRIVMVITDERFSWDTINSRSLRALILRENKDVGACEEFETVPKVYKRVEEFAEDYPIVLQGTITIEGAIE